MVWFGLVNTKLYGEWCTIPVAEAVAVAVAVVVAEAGRLVKLSLVRCVIQ